MTPLHGLIDMVERVAFSFWPLVMASQDPSRHSSHELTLFIVTVAAIKTPSIVFRSENIIIILKLLESNALVTLYLSFSLLS